MPNRAIVVGLATAAGLLAGCAATRAGTSGQSVVALVGSGLNSTGDSSSMDLTSGTGVHPEHGLVMTTMTEHYLIVLDILAPEDMFTTADVATSHPGTGELVVNGKATPTIGVNIRHLEVHIYDRTTGAVIKSEHPQLSLTDLTDGTTMAVDGTEMRDLIIGEIDEHYGSNSSVAVGHDFTLHVAIRGDTADLSGVVK